MIDAILAGASGYVAGRHPGDEIAAAVKAVGAGKSLLDNRAAQVLMDRLRKRPNRPSCSGTCPPPNAPCLALLGEGLTNREIGQRMFPGREDRQKLRLTAFCPSLGLSGRTEAALLGAGIGAPPRGLNAIR